MADLYDQIESQAPPDRSRLERFLLFALAIMLAYTALAYLALPALWTHYEHQKGLANLPMVTRTAQGIPGDPINVGLVGDNKDVLCAMHAAGWFPADPVTLRSSIEIAGSVLLDRPYHDAPVSPSVLSRPPRGSRVRKAGRQERRSPPSCAVLESAGAGPGTAAGLARRRDLSTAASASAIIPAPSPTTSAPISTPNASCSPPTSKPPAWSTPNTR